MPDQSSEGVDHAWSGETRLDVLEGECRFGEDGFGEPGVWGEVGCDRAGAGGEDERVEEDEGGGEVDDGDPTELATCCRLDLIRTSQEKKKLGSQATDPSAKRDLKQKKTRKKGRLTGTRGRCEL